MIKFKVSPKMAKYLKDHPYMEPHGLQEQQDEDDDDFWEIDPYKESDFTPAQLLVLKSVFDKQFDKIDMDSPEISKAVYSLNKDGYINFDTGEITDPGRIILSDIYGGKYDFETYLFGGLNEKFSKEERKKRAKKCDNPKGFTMKQFCKNQKTRSKKGERTNEGKDPKKGTGKKPKGSGRRLYTDENPKDTVSVKFRTVQDIKDTLSKASFKSKSHKRQSQIINLIHQRARAAYRNAKDPKVKKRLKKAYDYATERKEASKRKTKRMQKEQKEIKKVVSFDFDDTLALSQWDDNLDEFVYVGPHKEMLAKIKKYVNNPSYTVYVITSRHENKEDRIPEEHPNGKAVQEYLDEQGIIVDGVYFTNGQLKKEKLIELGVDIHHDDDPEEVRAAEEADVEVVVSDPYGDYKRLQKTLNEEEPFQKAVKKKHRKMKIRLIGLGGGKNTPGTTKPSYKRSKSAPPGFGGSLEENK